MLSGSRIYGVIFSKGKFHLWGVSAMMAVIDPCPAFFIVVLNDHFNNSGLKVIYQQGSSADGMHPEAPCRIGIQTSHRDSYFQVSFLHRN